ncbi:hypothetical protein Hanom_Chr03g00188361 [Helianthus anomalus]
MGTKVRKHNNKENTYKIDCAAINGGAAAVVHWKMRGRGGR